MNTGEYKAKTHFVAKLGLSLHECGATSHRIERHLTNLCEVLNINGEFLPTQTSFTFIFWDEDPADQLILIRRTQPSGGDLGLLDRLDCLIDNFADNELSFDVMEESLEYELSQPPYYSKLVLSIAWGMGSFAFSTLLSPSSYNAIAASISAIIIFNLLEYCSKYQRFNNLSELVGTSTAAIIISIIAALGFPVNIPFCILSAVIVIIPGLAITVALNEIANRDLVSGTARFVDAVMSMIKLFMGALIGIGISSFLFSSQNLNVTDEVNNLPSWIIYPSILLLAITITIAFNIPSKYRLWCILSSIISFIVSTYGTEQFNQPTGVFLGACAVTLFANIFSNVFKHPASLVLSTGLIFLVPGSKTYLILNSWVTGKQIVSNTPNATQAFMTFFSLIAGLLLSNAVITTRKSL